MDKSVENPITSRESSPPKTDGTTPAIKFSQEEQVYHKHITLGIEEKLQKNRMIKDINLTIKKPTEKSTISGWERKYVVSLPQDLKDYYLSTNGFKLTWSLEHAGDNLKIGEININSIAQLLPLDSISQLDSSRRGSGGEDKRKSKLAGDFSKLDLSNRKLSDEGAEANSFPFHFSELRQTMETKVKSLATGLFLSSNDKGFILDQNKYGWVCLIYPEAVNKSIVNPPNSPRSLTEPPQTSEPNVEIWFLDNSLQWHYLAPTFSHYYRMLLFHLGLPQWQYRFTKYGLSSWAEQMFWLVAPHLLTIPKISKSKGSISEGLWSMDVPADAASPNPTPNVLSNQIFRRKKKDKVEKL